MLNALLIALSNSSRTCSARLGVIWCVCHEKMWKNPKMFTKYKGGNLCKCKSLLESIHLSILVNCAPTLYYDKAGNSLSRYLANRLYDEANFPQVPNPQVSSMDKISHVASIERIRLRSETENTVYSTGCLFFCFVL